MKNRIMIMAISLFAGFTAAAQSQHVTLQQAIDMSIKNSKNLRISDARILEATADVREAKDRQLPDLKVSGSYLRLTNANIDLKSSDNSGGEGGGPNVNQALYGMANLSLPLYAGGRIKYGIESAKYLEQAARLNAESDRQGIIFNTMQAYTNLYKASRAVSVIRENVKASAQRDTVFSRLEQNGLLARNDLLKAQLQTSNIELSLLDAESNRSVANTNMNLMLGLPDNTEIETDSNFVADAKEQKTFIEIQSLALQNRKDLQAVGLQKKAASLGIKSARAEAFPTIALTGGYVAADIPKVLTVTNAVNIGVGVSYNLASLWKNNTKLAQARARETEIIATQELLNDNIRLQINKDYQNYLLAQRKIEVYDKAIAQATENYRITKNKYDNSLVTITDLLEADVSLLQARLNAAYARADLALAYNKLLETTGTL